MSLWPVELGDDQGGRLTVGEQVQGVGEGGAFAEVPARDAFLPYDDDRAETVGPGSLPQGPLLLLQGEAGLGRWQVDTRKLRTATGGRSAVFLTRRGVLTHQAHPTRAPGIAAQALIRREAPARGTDYH